MLPATPPAEVRPAPHPALAAAALLPRSTTITANGLRFACTEWGDPKAPLVLCLHGFPVTASTWNHLGPALAKAGYHVVAPAMRGYYPTEAPKDDEYGAATLGQDALALMSALGAEQATLVGHDWGAVAALAATTLAPTRVTKLVTVAIPHPQATTPDAIFKASHFVTYPLPGAGARFGADDVAGLDALLHKWSPTWQPTAAERDAAKYAFRRPGGSTAIFGYYRCLARDGVRKSQKDPRALTLGTFATPTLMIYGAADGAVDSKHFEASRRFFAGAFETVGIPNAGHFPQQENPEPFNRAVTAFVSECIPGEDGTCPID
jgi:pimeloyl-ACP methyl ester carboxylesterase